MPTRIRTEFQLTGEGFDPDKVTTLVGIDPTKTWRKGDRIPSTILIEKYTGWTISSPEETSIHLDKQIVRLLKPIVLVKDKIIEAYNTYGLEAELSCFVFVEGQTPVIHFDSQIVKLAAELGAEIDVDLYQFD